jgi:DNA-binding NtrC family response regulator
MEDVALLAKHFVQKHAPKRKDVLIKCISGEAMSLLLEHPYPGNVRELENIIERSISFANTSEVLPADLPPNIRQAQAPVKHRASAQLLKDALTAVEKETITAALLESGGNISRAATLLGIYRQQLQRKIKQHKITV